MGECLDVSRVNVCDVVQMRTVPLGLDNIVLPSEATRRKTFEAASETSQAGGDSSQHKWRVGELEFEALMRRLENAVSCSAPTSQYSVAHSACFWQAVFHEHDENWLLLHSF